METKELKIQAPEGYEIDKENSTLNKLLNIEEFYNTISNVNNIIEDSTNFREILDTIYK